MKCCGGFVIKERRDQIKKGHTVFGINIERYGRGGADQRRGEREMTRCSSRWGSMLCPHVANIINQWRVKAADVQFVLWQISPVIQRGGKAVNQSVDTPTLPNTTGEWKHLCVSSLGVGGGGLLRLLLYKSPWLWGRRMNHPECRCGNFSAMSFL